MAIQKYLPAGTRLVVRQPDGKTPWHTTREDVALPLNVGADLCPRTRLPVQTFTHKDHQLYFAAEVIAERTIPDPSDFDQKAVRNLRACLLIYDIPERAEIDNPSGYLRRLAVRVNLSCWVIPEHNIPYTLLNTMRAAGATWHVVKFDASEGRKLVEMALGALRQEVADALRRSRAAEASAERQLADTTEERDRAEERYLRRAEGIRERFKELSEDLKVAASQFGINHGSLGLHDAVSAIQAIGSGMEARARLYAEATRRLRESGTTTGAGVANMADSQIGSGAEFMANVMSDLLEEQGEPQLAAATRTAFGHQEPEVADDGTFDLVSPEERSTD